MVTVGVRDVEAGPEAAQYRGYDAERDVGPPTEPARVAEGASEAEERRQRAMSVSSGTWNGPHPRPGNLREVAEERCTRCPRSPSPTTRTTM